MSSADIRFQILDYIRNEGPFRYEGKLPRVGLKKQLAHQNHCTQRAIQVELDALNSVGTIKQSPNFVWIPGLILNDRGLYAQPSNKETTMKKKASKKKASKKVSKKKVAKKVTKRAGKKKAGRKKKSKVVMLLEKLVSQSEKKSFCSC